MKRLLSYPMLFLLIFYTGNQVNAEEISLEDTIKWMNKNTQHLKHDYVFSVGSYCELITKFTFRDSDENPNCYHKDYTPMEKVRVKARPYTSATSAINLRCKQDEDCATLTSNYCMWRRNSSPRKYIVDSKLNWGSVISVKNKAYMEKYVKALKNFQRQCLKSPKDLF